MHKKNLAVLFFIISIAIVACQKSDTTPSTSDRDKFIGTWHVNSHGTVSGGQAWDMVISASNSAPEQILISNFDQQNNTTTIASVSGNNFSISSQHIGSETVHGSGSYTNSSLSFSYYADDVQTVDTVTATAHK